MVEQPVQQAMVGPGKTQSNRIRADVSGDKLTASVRLSFPTAESGGYTVEDIKAALADKRITFGLDLKAIDNIIRESQFDVDVPVAKGAVPVEGAYGRLIFHFEEIQKLQPKEDADGRIDYKDINFIRCAEKGKLLVERIPPQQGIPGTNVYGEPIAAKPGKDKPLPIGPNTYASEDGLKLFAGVDGAIIVTGKHITINEVHTIGGGVNTKTGNIKHNGSLIIRGKVEANFEVVAKGDIEIQKSVGDAKIISGGNVMVKGGFLGNRNGLIKAEGDVHCKYIDDQVIDAGHSVYIGGEIYNSLITAKVRIIASGSKGRIVGGKIMAGDEIKASILGSEAGTRTELHVAYNPELMKKYYAATGELRQLDGNEERINEGLYTFYRLQMDGKLTAEKAAALKKLEEYKKSLPQRRKELTDEMDRLRTEIQKNQRAKIIAVNKVYPGVVLHFGVIYKEITDPMGPSYFQLTGSTITHEEYKPGKDDR